MDREGGVGQRYGGCGRGAWGRGTTVYKGCGVWGRGTGSVSQRVCVGVWVHNCTCMHIK